MHTSAAILGRAAQPDYSSGFDHAGGGIESILRKQTARGARDEYVYSPPLTAEELADIKEVFEGGEMAEIMRKIDGNRDKMPLSLASEGGSEEAGSGMKGAVSHVKGEAGQDRAPGNPIARTRIDRRAGR